MLRLWRYYLDFALFPPLALGLALYDARSLGWVALCGLGILIWTLAEYWTHRVILHGPLWHATHERHHRVPREHVEIIWWYAPLGFFLLFWLVPIAILVGLMLGYCVYLAMHHAAHHLPSSWLAANRRRHAHHHLLTRVNFGISSPLWDHVFRTAR